MSLLAFPSISRSLNSLHLAQDIGEVAIHEVLDKAHAERGREKLIRALQSEAAKIGPGPGSSEAGIGDLLSFRLEMTTIGKGKAGHMGQGGEIYAKENNCGGWTCERYICRKGLESNLKVGFGASSSELNRALQTRAEGEEGRVPGVLDWDSGRPPSSPGRIQ
ncbi:hypothetical protein B0H14DRAFT_2592255 [Mycena olivaceomarginata]|nr:hypothetical protein B0H14DRAFT_2592255 [Mycena olivaceomarginata]